MSNLVAKFKKQVKRDEVDWNEIDNALKEIVGANKFKVFTEVNKIRMQLIKLAKEEEA